MCGECGKKTRYLIIADGSEDEKIQSEGLKEYQWNLRKHLLSQTLLIQ